ncbi:hypothetical protein PLICRDRAFT_47131 [Plicaturopsis crispa FD-325 SS-3]|uniref:Palmitoyltransferase n=1 Tax=Plicaturopsis crispa FD-325 SS-3 TaxID=944288 RepID=A0A0C9SKF6_PLICR|nr:hypothetical protein PLICRDRAFT_47131 [Plicaturopsis crispa FD-325 SS-3]
MAAGDPGHRENTNRTCCGVINEARYAAREKKARRKKQPWLVLKFTVGIASAIIAYAAYVYIGRLCVPMILRRPDAQGSRAMGIAFLIVFCIFLLMAVWSYIVVLFTSPGYAAQHVPKCARPIPRNAPPPPPRRSNDTDSTHIGGGSYEASLPTPRFDLSVYGTHENTPTVESAPHFEMPLSEKDPRPHRPDERYSLYTGNDVHAGVLDTLPAPAPGPTTIPPLPVPNATGLPPPLMSRRPPTTPVLLPEYRYCPHCEIVKPYRTHHCRACGTCVLKYDHHCPWIGQCVGARNHKFFLIFCQWCLLYCLWIFTTLIGLNVSPSSSPAFDIDPQQIAIIAISGVFALFTGLLYASHVILIFRNTTTVESLGVRDMKERERATLAHMYPMYSVRAKAKTVKAWDEEWGRIGKEGHLWWLGSKRANWESVMGTRRWGWFLPIGRDPNAGLHYDPNPRFDAEGRWLRRSEWPEELR